MKEFNNIIILSSIKSKYIIKKISENIQRKKFLNIIRYNKSIRNRLDITFNDYKECATIEIKIIPKEKYYGEFFSLSYDEPNIHIYFDDNKEEIIRENKNEITEDDEVKSITIILDNKTRSLKKLFSGCDIIKKISFIRFNITDINDMSEMFFYCKSIEELDLSNFKTENVTNMKSVFL